MTITENDGHQILMGSEAMQRISDELDCFPQMTFDEAERLAMRIGNQDEKRHILSLLSHARERGLRLPSQIKNLKYRLEADLSDTVQTIEATGGLTGVSSMNPKREAGMSWQVLEDGADIIATNFWEGQFGWIAGFPGTGKTDLGLKVIERWVGMGHEALSNIRLRTPPDGYHYVRNAQENFLAVANILEACTDAKTLLLIDDISAAKIGTEYASTTRDKDFHRWAKVAVRKLGCNAVVIEQLESKVPTIFQEFSTSRFTCHKVITDSEKERGRGGEVTINLTGPHRYFRERIKDLPKSNLEYRTRDIAFFDLGDFDFDKLFLALDGATDQPKAIRRSLEV